MTDLASFRSIVDSHPDGVTAYKDDLQALSLHVGLPPSSCLTSNAVSEELYKKIRNAFVSGHQAVWRSCRQFRHELIQRHVIDDEPLEPYFSVVEHLQDAVRSEGLPRDEIRGDWGDAIRYAYDHTRFRPFGTEQIQERKHQRDFEVARAAKRIQARGYRLIRKNGDIFLDPESETYLVAELERIVGAMGGLNVARRVFRHILPLYDPTLERYHLVRRINNTGGGTAQPPLGYLLLLSAKHPIGRKPLKNTEENWRRLLELSTDYAAVLDVQSYTHSIWGAMDAVALLPHMQELAIHDTLFCIPQIRGSDVVQIARGVLDGMDFEKRRGSGWTIAETLTVIASLLDSSRDVRGPIPVSARAIKDFCPDLTLAAIERVLAEVLSHPASGANQRFSKPTDAPAHGTQDANSPGHDFFQRPLMRIERGYYMLLDRAICSSSCLEALFTPLRNSVNKFDDEQLGPAVERFLRAEFAKHGIPSLAGKYCIAGEHGQCDLVVETPDTIVFVEIKKKCLTRRARSGSDAYLMLDLANSLLDAQIQAGWHEIRLRQHESIELDDDGTKTRLALGGRHIVRVAATLLDYGSFQDRILLKQFLQGNLNAQYSVDDESLKKRFEDINKSLAHLSQQFEILGQEKKMIANPFFHCWFLSIPQLLVVLDGVQGPEAFKKSLMSSSAITTGSQDFYAEHAYMKKLKAEAIAANLSTNRSA